MLTVELHAHRADFSDLEPEWERLFMARPHEPCASFEWASALRDHHPGCKDALSVLIGRRGGRISLILPLVRERSRIGCLPLTSTRVLWEVSGTHSDLLCENLDATVVTTLLHGCRVKAPGWDILRFARVLEGSILDRALSQACTGPGVMTRCKRTPPSFFLELPESFEIYLQGRSSKFRNYLRRMEKRLQRRGECGFVKLTDRDGFSGAYEALLQVERSSWKHGHGTAISAIPHQSAFYRDMAKGALEAGRLHLTFLRVDELPVAYNLGLVAHGRYFYLKTSFVEEYRRKGVATVCRARLIELLISEGIREFDFPGEPYEWETQWTRDLRRHRSFVFYNKTVMGRTCYLLETMRDLVQPGANKGDVVFCDPRDLQPPR